MERLHPSIRIVLAILAGMLSGGMLNLFIVNFGHMLIPPPAGVDLTTTEGLLAAMPMMEPRHFLMPWLAHALGTLLSAFVACRLANNHFRRISIGLGVWNMVGGLLMIIAVPGPLWFTLIDIVLAYLPFGWLGGRLAVGKEF
jgi:choline-glycine betaine transporter